MPGEGTLPHAKIQVWCVDAFDLDPAVALHRVQNGVEAADVPFSHILQRRETAGAVSRIHTDVQEQRVKALTGQREPDITKR